MMERLKVATLLTYFKLLKRCSLQCKLHSLKHRLLGCVELSNILNRLCMYWTNLELNEFDLMELRLYYNELELNWLELDCISEVP